MTTVELLHNPGAGDESHEKEDLMNAIQHEGYQCRYTSTKSKKLSISSDVDFVVVAGGDGTVRKITKELLERNVLDKQVPIALIPLGTANNIAKTLGIKGSAKEIIQQWKYSKPVKYDVGRVFNVEKAPFFLESFGYGLFPYLMQKMKKLDESLVDTPDKKIQNALRQLHEIIESYDAKYCSLKIDGIDYSGTYLLAEMMNIKSIGPNLMLASDADPGDGMFEVVLIKEEHRSKLAYHIYQRIKGIETSYSFESVKAKKIKISWDGTHVHADDKVVKLEKSALVEIEIREGLLRFLIGGL